MFQSIKLIRVIKEGFVNFYRDKWLTIATITIITLTLYLIGATFFLWVGVSQTIAVIEKRINVSVYFDYDVPEDRIKKIERDIREHNTREIKDIRYVSQEEALKKFKEEEKDNEDIQKALEVIGENPLPPSLVITANHIKDYDVIDAFFKKKYGDLILSTNFEKNKEVIEQIQQRITFTRNATFFLSILFIAIAVLVTFNTIRMSIYAHRKEFEVMRLVGASNLYVKIPVITEGILYGIISALVAVLFLIVTIYAIDPFAQKTLSDANIFSFYRKSIALMGMITIVSGVILGFVSSYIAILRYLKK